MSKPRGKPYSAENQPMCSGPRSRGRGRSFVRFTPDMWYKRLAEHNERMANAPIRPIGAKQ